MDVLNNLPIEIIVEFFLKIDGRTLGTCRGVCKKWKNIIDSSDYLWEKTCYRDFPLASKIAKEKRDNACKWNYIYRNLHEWNNSMFTTKWNSQFQELDISLYEFCTNFANNDYALIIFNHLVCSLRIVRPADNTEYKSERYFQAMGFSLYGDKLYFYQDKDVFLCELLSPEMDSIFIHHCDYSIKQIKHINDETFLFTNCGKIVTLSRGNVLVQPINFPPQWINQIKHISAINDKNYICYSRNLFSIETDKQRHLYLEFKTVTALFFYGGFVLIAERQGEILIYRLSAQKFSSRPIMEPLATLPDGHYAVQLDVVERRSGPVIIATTLRKIFLLEINLFPQEKDDELPLSIRRLQMYKRLLENRSMMKMQNIRCVLGNNLP